MHILKAIESIGRLVFTTGELASLAGISLSSANQRLSNLERKKIIAKIKRGVWGRVHDKNFDPLQVIPFLSPSHRAYLSFLSALNKYGMIDQIPQEISVASTAHSKRIKTTVGTYAIHQLAPEFFDGFVLSKNSAYYIATPEKAFIDCLYLSCKRGRQFSFFPEIDLTSGFSFKNAKLWAKKIIDKRIQRKVLEKLNSRLR